MTQYTWIEASPSDEQDSLALMQAFYAEDKILFQPDTALTATREMLHNPQLGRIFLLKNPTEPDSAAMGYLVLAFWHSLEFGGRVVVLDELYLGPAVRGQGWAPRTLQMVRDWARTQNAVAVRLEVNHHNTRAKSIYLKAGFADDKRDIMTERL